MKPEYQLSCDTQQQLKRIKIDDSARAQKYGNVIGTIFSDALSKDFDVRIIPEEQIISRLAEKAKKVDPRNGVIIDRGIADALSSRSIPMNTFSMARTTDGSYAPRPGDRPFSVQTAILRMTTDPDNIVVFDDGAWTGGTFDALKRIWNENGFVPTNVNMVGYTGPRSNRDDIQILDPRDNLSEWIDMRDVGLWGGKIDRVGKLGKVATATSYLAPFSTGRAASLDLRKDLYSVSRACLKAYEELLEDTNDPNDPILLRDWIKSGFAIPVSQSPEITKALNPTLNMTMIEYAKRAQEVLRQELKRPVVFCDMDGTLYGLNNGNGYTGSRLEAQVKAGINKFAQDRFGLDYESIVDSAMKDPRGASYFFRDTYDISRSDYLNTAWGDIDPEGIIEDKEIAKKFVDVIKARNAKLPFQEQTKLVLVTSAPAVWTNKVLRYLGIEKQWEDVRTGEMFDDKGQVFTAYAGGYEPQKCISIGDQTNTDLMPASRVGMRTQLIKNPQQLLSIYS